MPAFTEASSGFLVRPAQFLEASSTFSRAIGGKIDCIDFSSIDLASFELVSLHYELT
jgi:hypothetical protein